MESQTAYETLSQQNGHVAPTHHTTSCVEMMDVAQNGPDASAPADEMSTSNPDMSNVEIPAYLDGSVDPIITEEDEFTARYLSMKSPNCMIFWLGIALLHIGVLSLMWKTNNEVQLYVVLVMLVMYSGALLKLILMTPSKWFNPVLWIWFVWLISGIGCRLSSIIGFYYYGTTCHYFCETADEHQRAQQSLDMVLNLFLGFVPAFFLAVYVFIYFRMESMIFSMYTTLLRIALSISFLIKAETRTGDDYGFLWDYYFPIVTAISFVIACIAFEAGVSQRWERVKSGWLLLTTSLVIFIGSFFYLRPSWIILVPLASFFMNATLLLIGIIFPALPTTLLSSLSIFSFIIYLLLFVSIGGVMKYLILSLAGVLLIAFATVGYRLKPRERLRALRVWMYTRRSTPCSSLAIGGGDEEDGVLVKEEEGEFHEFVEVRMFWRDDPRRGRGYGTA